MFTTIFLIELLIRLSAERRFFFYDGWNNFDFVLVTIAVFDTYILQLMVRSESSELNTLSLLRILFYPRPGRELSTRVSLHGGLPGRQLPGNFVKL